jgi:hypothetical protein
LANNITLLCKHLPLKINGLFLLIRVLICLYGMCFYCSKIVQLVRSSYVPLAKGTILQSNYHIIIIKLTLMDIHHRNLFDVWRSIQYSIKLNEIYNGYIDFFWSHRFFCRIKYREIFRPRLSGLLLWVWWREEQSEDPERKNSETFFQK